MAASSFTSHLNSRAPSYSPVALPVGCPLLPPLVPASGWPVSSGSSFAPRMSCLPPIFPLPWWVQPSPPPQQALPVRHCSIEEIVGDDGSDDSPKAKGARDDNPSPRSVLTPWRRPQPAPAARPPPSPRVWDAKPAFDSSSDKTSVMICNIPNSFSKRRLMAILDQHCAVENNKFPWLAPGAGLVVRSEYDFLYVPVDFRTGFNKGYAFVNMTTAAGARRLHAFLHGHPWAMSTGSRKVCEVVHAHIQGVDALVAHFSGSKFPCGEKEFLPMRFGPPRNGLRPTAERVIGRALKHNQTDMLIRPPHA